MFMNIIKKLLDTEPIIYGNVKCEDCKYYLNENYVMFPDYGDFCSLKKIIKRDAVKGEYEVTKRVRCDKKNKYNDCLDFELKIEKELVPPKGGIGVCEKHE